MIGFSPCRGGCDVCVPFSSEVKARHRQAFSIPAFARSPSCHQGPQYLFRRSITSSVVSSLGSSKYRGSCLLNKNEETKTQP